MIKETISEKQAHAMAQVCLDLHDALGCKWGDNPYLTISQLKAAAPALQAELDATNRQVEILSDALAESRREVAALKAVQEPVAYEYGDDVFWHDSPDINDYIRANGNALVYATPPAAQPAPPECQTEAEKTAFAFGWWKALESVRQPAVPDAIVEAGESPDYRDGWNDCRQAMLKGMK
jgi:hypothetical protein